MTQPHDRIYTTSRDMTLGCRPAKQLIDGVTVKSDNPGPMAKQPPRRQRRAREVSRRIHFYRIYTAEDRPFDANDVLAEVEARPIQDRYMPYNTSMLMAWVHGRGARPRMRLARVDRNDWPLMDLGGDLQELAVEAEEAGVAYPMHIVFWPKLAIAGADFNFTGPRMRGLADYLHDRAPGSCPLIDFRPLVRRDVRASLERFEYIRLLDLRVDEHAIPATAEVDQQIHQVFESARSFSGAGQVEVIMRVTPYDRDDSLSQRAQDAVLRIFDRPELVAGISRLSISGPRRDGGGTDTVDLIKDQLVYEEVMIRLKGRTRAIDPISAFGAIEKAFDNNADEIQAASAI